MTDLQIDQIISALTGRRDKHVLAVTRNYERRQPNDPLPPVLATTGQMRRFRRLGLATKRAGHEKAPVQDAEHVLTEKGRIIADVINDRFTLALAIPSRS
ncbi:hypothetical protein [Yoonia sp. 2307UL14-13]|uniref:hypothetical protein n=1 Tax=Yoonia sp. 2307UL14-13 TaxID=3126506 RepID=UPI0030AD5B79